MGGDAPLVRYPVRTPAWVWAGVGLFAVVGAVLAAPELLYRPGFHWWSLALAAAGAAGLAGLTLWASRAWRVGAPTIDLYRDHVDIPRPWRGRARFPLASLKLLRVRLRQEIEVVSLIPSGIVLDRGEIVTFIGPERRRLSDRVFAEPQDLQHLLVDLQAASSGQAPLGPAGWRAVAGAFASAAAATAQPRSARERELEARLDAELKDDR